MITRKKLKRLGSARVGDSFIYRNSEIFGTDGWCRGRPRLDGKMLTVVAFPHELYQVVVRDAKGRHASLSLWEVEEALGWNLKKQTVADNATAQVV